MMNTVDAIKNLSQINKMKEYLKTRSTRDYCLFLLGINTGIRINELIHLRVSDVMTADEKVRDFLDSAAYANPPVYFNRMVREAIQDCIHSEGLEHDDYLFKSKKTMSPISRQQAYRIISEAARYSGIEGAIGTTTLRKTFGYHAYQKGIAISLIQKRLQQSTPSETIQFIGLANERHSLPIILDVNL
ncbi:tyrosine-type recombinase/integrase [Robertmurraya massiliosenegalensis]|uniref:tyrosine-type recombinase/integrase n=2 Tax=Robertmurraya massiliosenegalensis TaxID=1287657 RepID=UPI0021CC48AC|nr:tyrosine-type recombinase/integrase [Robertmurraya massiliosenegalensis]